MNSSPVLQCLKQAWVWTLFVFVVASIAILFNVLGTITCAVLSGMMLAGIRRPAWHAVLASLTFPAVHFGLLQVTSKVVDPHHALVLGALGFGAFWMMYLLTRLILALESRSGGTKEGVTGQLATTPQIAREGPPEGGEQSPPFAPPMPPATVFDLEQLQGCWLCRQGDASQAADNKRIDITGNKFTLHLRGRNGADVVVASGIIKVQCADSFHTLMLEGSAADVIKPAECAVSP